MAAQFNSPPGWPTPPEGWTPPPGWSPDPSWPAAPEGWQFWIDDAAATPPVTQPPDPQSTQTMGTSPTQVLPTSGPGVYSYAPSAGPNQPGASPYGGQGQPPGGFPGQGQYPQPGGPTPQKRNTGAIIAVVVVAALVLGGLAWGLTSLFSGGSDPDPTATSAGTSSEEPTSEEATSEEATSEEATSEEATSEEPTDDPGGSAGGFTDLTGTDPALVMGLTATDPIAELRLQEVVTDWQPDGNSMLCSDPENGQYLGLKFELTTTDALAEEDPPTYNFIGWEIGAQVDGVTIESNGFGSGLFCLGEGQQFPSDMEPGQTYEGWVILDVPDTVTAAIYDDPLDFTGDGGMYRWVLADQ
jgi:hypothetical protein